MDIWGSNYDTDNEQEFKSIDEQEFKSTYEQEASAFGSANQARECGDPIPFHIKPGTKEYYQALANKTPLEKFKLDVDYVSRLLTDMNDDVLTLTVKDRNILCEKADNVTYIGLDPMYLNVLAYILGYIANKKDGTIKEKVSFMKKIIGSDSDDFSKLKDINETASKARSGNSFSVFPADVIRYAKMWNILYDT